MFVEHHLISGMIASMGNGWTHYRNVPFVGVERVPREGRPGKRLRGVPLCEASILFAAIRLR